MQTMHVIRQLPAVSKITYISYKFVPGCLQCDVTNMKLRHSNVREFLTILKLREAAGAYIITFLINL